MYRKTESIWMDGKIVPWADAKVHVLTHTLHYGVGVFEGIRYYDCGERSAVFRLKEHVRRLLDSCKVVSMAVPFDAATLEAACIDMARRSGLKEGYIRPLAYIGEEPNVGLWAFDNAVHVSIIAYGWGAYLGDKGLAGGIRVKTSSYMRHHRNIAMTSAKVTGQYFNSVLAKREAVAAGYDEALMLDPEGYVAEGTGENLFMVKDGTVYTPLPHSVLRGITRDTVLRLFADRGTPVQERALTRDDLYVADEIFFTGTAAEITPVRELDNRPIGDGQPGSVTRDLQRVYADVVRGKNAQYRAWTTPVGG